jgi:CDGSH-type Zn-finger protein/uncharacterized Fe-S cluster protein YjdI
MVETVRGSDVTVIFEGQRCVHARNCVLSHPEVFVPNVQGEWIFPDAAPAADVIRIGLNCPSGAIRVIRNDRTETSDKAPRVNTLRLRENGPLALEAPMQLRGQALDAPRATLCRCGASQNKPFCDGSHAGAGFAASGEVLVKESVSLAERSGPVDLSPQPNGPLKLTGAVEVVTGTGHTVNRATTLFLCRCGQSQNKPYCDGSHKAAGFVAD